MQAEQSTAWIHVQIHVGMYLAGLGQGWQRPDTTAECIFVPHCISMEKQFCLFLNNTLIFFLSVKKQITP